MKNYLNSILKSPVTHFIVLGVIFYLLYIHILPPTAEKIYVTTQTIDALVQQRESITQSAMTEEEMNTLIANHIEEEILLREAYKRGFDKNDYRVRKRILNIMRSTLSEIIPEPSVGQLKQYYKEYSEKYLSSPSLSFEQIFFSFSSANLPENPESYSVKLNQAEDLSLFGEFSQLGLKFSKLSFRQTAQIFGKPFTEKVYSMALGTWEGPIESFRGIHYVRVTEKHDPELAPFEEMENYLRTDYQMKKTREGQERKIEELGRNYEVIVEKRKGE